MAATQQLPDSGDTPSPTEQLGECESLADVADLNRETVNQTHLDNGRVRKVRWRVLTTPSEIVELQSGDKIVFDDGRRQDILDVGDSVSEGVGGIHALVDHPTDSPSAIHLRLFRKWLTHGQIVVAGLRTCEYSEKTTERNR